MSDLLERLREREVPDWLRALYSVIYLTTFIHAILTRGAWTCCPPAYGEFETFVHSVQIAFGWTGATAAAMEALTVMVLLVPKVYYGIKEKGRREGKLEGEIEGRREGRLEGKLEGEREGRREGRLEGKLEGRLEGEREGRREGERQGVDAMMEAMRAAGIDEETRRRVEDIHAKRNGR